MHVHWPQALLQAMTWMLGRLLHGNDDKVTVLWTAGKVWENNIAAPLKKALFCRLKVRLIDKIGHCASCGTAWPLQFASCAYELKLPHTIVVQYTCLTILLSCIHMKNISASLDLQLSYYVTQSGQQMVVWLICQKWTKVSWLATAAISPTLQFWWLATLCMCANIMPFNPLITNDAFCCLTLAACYQVLQSVFKVGFALAKGGIRRGGRKKMGLQI